ncbi:zinc-binding alcohol dehydrogenase [Microbacterium yannicii]|uniref:Zinc-binding alcohol dehydrogenase n=1 Tax=Microbacterium yannicii TaxID=671622 RepID=A0ABP9M5Y6_9MICO|nr:zinc-binding alcohol dehydrogenase [Microbacterium yannicii]MCO5954756.1 zinc-binding alcohol dehydrogenase [Microbacterium yannicii]
MAVTGDTTQVPAAVHRDPAEAAHAWWTIGPGEGEFRSESLPVPTGSEASVRTLWTGISRGTEVLVARGEVPASERDRMRAPFQGGDFPFPVKYGYLNVGRVEEGPADLTGRPVFALVPHQSRYVVPVEALVPVPEGVPPRRAVLAGAVETAVNVLWDVAPLVGDRVVVVGAGMIGCAIARVARGIPGIGVTLIDVDPAKERLARELGADFMLAPTQPQPEPEIQTQPQPEADVVIEASGSGAGLELALRLASTDGEVIVASWYGSRPVPITLGADFHSRRLTIRSSQVGAVSSRRRSTRTTRDRLGVALRLLEDPAFDLLLGGTSSWRQLPEVTAALAAGTAGELCHTIDWSTA